MGRDIAQYTDEWFESRGYTFNESSSTWIPPAPKSAYIRQQEAINGNSQPFVDGDRILKDIPTVKLDVKTEWFIKSKSSVPSKKNSRQNFRNGISIPSKKHSEYVNETEMRYDMFGIEFRRAVTFYGLQYPLNIEFTFIRATKHSFDYCNACQTCEDIMKDKHDKKGNLVRKGWIPDDSADYIKPSFGDYQYDKNNAGVKIKLLLK